MQVEIRIVTTDDQFGFHLLESKRFPEYRPIIVPGEAIIVGQNMMAGDESVGWADIIDLGVDISENTSVEEFAAWLYEKLKSREEKIQLLVIAGAEIPIDEAEILRAIEDGLGKDEQ